MLSITNAMDKFTNYFLNDKPKGNSLRRQAQRAHLNAEQAKMLGGFNLAIGTGATLLGNPIAVPTNLAGAAFMYKAGECNKKYQSIISSDAYNAVVKRATQIAKHK